MKTDPTSIASSRFGVMDRPGEPAGDNSQSKVLEKGGRGAWIVLIVLVMLNILNYADRMVISVAMEAIKIDLGFSDTQMGMVQGFFLFSVGLLILPAGILVDRWSRRKAVSAMAVVWSGATVVTGMCSQFSTLLAARFFTGSGEAGFQPGGTAWISAVFKKKDRTKVNGIFLMGSLAGIVMGLAVGGILITKTGNWRIPFFIFGGPGILLGMTALFLRDKSVSEDAVSNNSDNLLKDLAGLFEKKTFIGASFGQGLFMVVVMTYQAWNVVLLIRGYQLDEAAAGTIMGMIFLPVIGAPLLGGIIADRMQARTKIGRPLFAGIGCIVATLAYMTQFLCAGSVSYPTYVAVMFVAGFLGAMPIPVFQVMNMDIFPLNRRGSASAMTGLITFLLFSWWGSILVGKVSDMLGGGVYGVKTAMLVTVPFGILAGIICIWSCKHYRQEAAELAETD